MLADEAHCLVCRIGSRRCALPVADVVEVTRRLPVEAVADAPEFVAGLALIRGGPVPVVDAGRLVGDPQTDPARLVVLRVAERRVALAVEACDGVRRLERSALGELPPLLREAAAEVVAAVGVLDGELVEALDAARLLSDEVLATLEAPVAAR